jgi:selenoprotein W-related protein
MKPRIEIHFCPGCRWWLRAGWMAQELFATYGDAIGEVALITAESGEFFIKVGDVIAWERKADGGFPEPKELKQRLQKWIDPAKDLGHSAASP